MAPIGLAARLADSPDAADQVALASIILLNKVSDAPDVEATEAAIVNALLAAETMVGRDGITAHALPHDRLIEIMAAHGRPVGG